MNMLYDVEKISELTHISKVTIYKKFKINSIKDCIVRKQGKAYVDEVGFNLIKQSLNLNCELNDNEVATDKIPTTTDIEDILKVKNDLINSLNDQTEFLRDQIKEKDIQMHELNSRLNQEQDLHKNTQILFKQQPQQNILALEAHFQDLDTKLEEVKGNMLHRKEQQVHSKGFLNNLFNKK